MPNAYVDRPTARGTRVLERSRRIAAAAKEEPAALLIEQCMFTLDGWLDAKEALAHAESIAEDDEQAGAAASELSSLTLQLCLADKIMQPWPTKHWNSQHYVFDWPNF
jgi:hypothetical protein